MSCIVNHISFSYSIESCQHVHESLLYPLHRLLLTLRVSFYLSITPLRIVKFRMGINLPYKNYTNPTLHQVGFQNYAIFYINLPLKNCTIHQRIVSYPRNCAILDSSHVMLLEIV